MTRTSFTLEGYAGKRKQIRSKHFLVEIEASAAMAGATAADRPLFPRGL